MCIVMLKSIGMAIKDCTEIKRILVLTTPRITLNPLYIFVSKKAQGDPWGK